MEKIISLDVGEKTIGIAENVNFIAFPLFTIKYKIIFINEAINEIIKLVKQKKINKIIIGYPVHLNNLFLKSKICRLVEKIKDLLKQQKLDLKIKFWDERFTTKIAFQEIKDNKTKVSLDSLAACKILQNYLDYKKMGL